MKKALSVLLALVMIFTCMPIAFAEEMETDKLKVEIKTDKRQYNYSENIKAIIKVENVSNDVLHTVQIQTASKDLIKIKGKTNEDVDKLNPGESVCFEIEIMPFCFSEKFSTFQKVYMFIHSLPYLKNVYYQSVVGWKYNSLNNVNYDYGVAESRESIYIGQLELLFKVKASYCIGKKSI